MNQALKQRLIGAVVLVALAVIFLPAVFNGGRPKQLNTLKDIPPMPEVAPLVVEEAPKPQAAADTAPASDMFALEPKSTGALEKIQSVTQSAIPPAKTASLNNKGAPNAWVLQIGVFSDKSKAEQLKKNLQAKGYRAFTRSVVRDKNAARKESITRVMIGPEFEQVTLNKIKTAVDHDFGVKSILVKFEP